MKKISNSRIRSVFLLLLLWFLFSWSHDVELGATWMPVQSAIIVFLIVCVIAFREKEEISIEGDVLTLDLVDVKASLALSDDVYCSFPESYTKMVVTTPTAKITAKVYTRLSSF
ncbi:MAG: hypothetical protein SD837_10455 [Candidatus Electrothrix scaldis]|nr:MAG: hypothetical protein SD837_10455 [Candidatus Electrothrix sp. GW3-3]